MYNVGVEVMLVLNCGGGRCPALASTSGFGIPIWNHLADWFTWMPTVLARHQFL